MNKYSSHCDEFYLNMDLCTEMDLPQNRETILHFFEQIQKRYPAMSNFYSRSRGEFCLEEEKDVGRGRWVSLEPRRLCSGLSKPESVEDATEQHCSVLELVPYELSVSHLDCESLNVTMGFDFTYRGNHDELMAEAIGLINPFEKLGQLAGNSVLNYEPLIQFAFDDDCKTQCRLAFETRTTAYQVRSGEFSEEVLSVYLTVRHFDSLKNGHDFPAELRRIAKLCEKVADEFLVESVLQPLQQTIALK